MTHTAEQAELDTERKALVRYQGGGIPKEETFSLPRKKERLLYTIW